MFRIDESAFENKNACAAQNCAISHRVRATNVLRPRTPRSLRKLQCWKRPGQMSSLQDYSLTIKMRS